MVNLVEHDLLSISIKIYFRLNLGWWPGPCWTIWVQKIH